MWESPKAMRHRAAWSLGAACILLACGPRALNGAPLATSAKPRVQLCLGLGASSASCPAKDLLVSVHPGVGWRLGLLFVPRSAERVAYDAGVLLDVRAVATRRTWPAWTPLSGRLDDTHLVTFSSVVLPIRIRVSGVGPRVRPYAAIGPELSVMLVAREDDRNVAEWADRLSWNLSGAVGVELAGGGHPMFLEVGSSFGMSGLGIDSGGPHESSSGLGDSRSRVILVAAGVDL
jgi:hypothetical protein